MTQIPTMDLAAGSLSHHHIVLVDDIEDLLAHGGREHWVDAEKRKAVLSGEDRD